MLIFLLWFHRDGRLCSAHSGASHVLSVNLCCQTRWEKYNTDLFRHDKCPQHLWWLPTKRSQVIVITPWWAAAVNKLESCVFENVLFTILALSSTFRDWWWEPHLHVWEWQRHVHEPDLPGTRLLLFVAARLRRARLLHRTHLQRAVLQCTSWLLHQLLLDRSLQRLYHTTFKHQSVPKAEIFGMILEDVVLKAKCYMAVMFPFVMGGHNVLFWGSPWLALPNKLSSCPFKVW